jgi:FkbM family methyltransferase
MLPELKKAIRDRLGRLFDVPEVPFALERLKANGFSPSSIFDVGAYSGEFARVCRLYWPQSKITCFEVLPERLDELRLWATRDGNTHVIGCLLGAKSEPEVPFHEMETASSVLEEHVPQSVPIRSYPMLTIDEIVASSNADAPQFLKMDVQGYEFEVLLGAKSTLSKIEVILAEVNFIDIHKGVHLVGDVVSILSESGFVAYDICGLHRRPLDRALWQADFVFVQRDGALRADKRWQS